MQLIKTFFARFQFSFVYRKASRLLFVKVDEKGQTFFGQQVGNLQISKGIDDPGILAFLDNRSPHLIFSHFEKVLNSLNRKKLIAIIRAVYDVAKRQLLHRGKITQKSEVRKVIGGILYTGIRETLRLRLIINLIQIQNWKTSRVGLKTYTN